MKNRRLRNVPFDCHYNMKRILIPTLLSLTVLLTAAEQPYDFRASEAYRKLSVADRQRLEQVHRDLVLLWGALDMYADGHNGRLPSTLDGLVPEYLAELPSDPFATPQSASGEAIPGYTPSKAGRGYRFMTGVSTNRAWCFASVGLTNFPYRAERGNVGLYVCKGLWISGANFTGTK